MHIGLYFGSFNPIHIGHLIIASFVANNTAVDEVWLVVSPQNPFKNTTDLLDENARLELARLAVENDPKLKVSDIEFDLPRPSYTIDTLTFLRQKYPEDTFCIIMGSDSFQTIGSWKNSEILVKEYSLFVYERPSFSLNILPPTVTMLDGPLLDISATAIRNAIRNGKSIRYWVTENVLTEIQDKGYYK